MRNLKYRLWLAGAVLLLLIAAGASFLWFHTLAPVRHLADDEGWVSMHSPQAIWIETQRKIARFGWSHDDGSRVGAEGDEIWVHKVMAQVARKGDEVFGCSGGHRDVALARITNWDFKQDAAAWLAWWKTNEHRSQAEWIQDGFRHAGFEVRNPLDTQTMRALLRALGTTNRPPRSPRGLSFNAFRWLRDHKFDPSKLKLADFQDTDGEAMFRGLVNYQRLLAAYPRFEPTRLPVPPLASPEFRIGAWSTILVSVALAVFCFMRWRLSRSPPASAPR